MAVSSGLQKTFEVLAASRNEAAAAVAIAAFESEEVSVRDRAIETLISRRSKLGHLALIRRWHELTPEQQNVVLEGRTRNGSALRDAILAEDPQLFQNSCEMVRITSDFDVIPTLVNIAEEANHPHARQATSLVHELVARLGSILEQSSGDRSRRAPEAIRNHLLDYLSRSVERFRYHKRPELIEAFIVLSGPSSQRLMEILDDPHHASFNTFVQIFSSSENPVVQDLLLRLLDNETVPATVPNTISKRADRPFVERLLQFAHRSTSSLAHKQLKRIRSFAWLKSSDIKLADLLEAQQAHLVQLLLLAEPKREELIAALEELLLRGAPKGRLAACRALASITGDQANKLILEAVYDPDPEVQAAATRQLRDRHIPGTMPMLLKLLDSPHEMVRTAARNALAEFSFENYLVGCDSMSLDARRSSGALVLKVDELFFDKLSEELLATAARRRLRALEIAENLHVVAEVVDVVMGLLGDEEHLVRAAAASALQYCRLPEVQVALQSTLDDPSPTVRSAARNALECLDYGRQHEVQVGKPILIEEER